MLAMVRKALESLVMVVDRRTLCRLDLWYITDIMSHPLHTIIMRQGSMFSQVAVIDSRHPSYPEPLGSSALPVGVTGSWALGLMLCSLFFFHISLAILTQLLLHFKSPNLLSLHNHYALWNYLSTAIWLSVWSFLDLKSTTLYSICVIITLTCWF